MDEITNGGPAFPYSALAPGGPVMYADNQGMTLRDYFAAQAMVGFLASPEFSAETGYEAEKCAVYAYEHADAMLKVREATGA